MKFNTFAKKQIKGALIDLSPLCDIYNNKKIHSDYSLWFNRPEVIKYNSHGIFPYKPDTDIKEILEDKSKIIWAIVSSEYINSHTTYTHIGNVSLQSINLLNRSAEIAIIIGEPEYYGKGIAKFAVKEICNHGFNKLGLNRIWSGTTAPNIGMQKVFESLGFKKEGTFKEAVFLNGKFEDVYEYGLLTTLFNVYSSPIQKLANYNSYQELNNENSISQDQILIGQIEAIRGKNNTKWMDLVRLAFELSPKKAREIFNDIVKYDAKIQQLSKKLSEK